MHRKSFRPLGQAGFSLTSVLVSAGLVGVVALGVMKLTKQSTTAQKDFSTRMEVDVVVSEIRSYLSVPENCEETFQGRNALDDSSSPTLTALKVKNNSGVFVDRFMINNSYGQGTIKILDYKLSDPGVTTDDVDVIADNTTYLVIQFYLGKAASRSELSRKIKLKVQVDGSNNITSCTSFSNDGGIWSRNASDPSKIYYNTGNVGVGTSDPQVALDVMGGIKLADSPNCDASLNGLMKFDGTKMLICEEAQWRPVSNAGEECPPNEVLKGFNPDGTLKCEPSSSLSTTQYFEITGGTGTTSNNQSLGNWKFCAMARQKTSEDDENNYDGCRVNGSFNGPWTLELTKHSQDSLTCGAICLK